MWRKREKAPRRHAIGQDRNHAIIMERASHKGAAIPASPEETK